MTSAPYGLFFFLLFLRVNCVLSRLLNKLRNPGLKGLHIHPASESCAILCHVVITHHTSVQNPVHVT